MTKMTSTPGLSTITDVLNTSKSKPVIHLASPAKRAGYTLYTFQQECVEEMLTATLVHGVRYLYNSYELGAGKTCMSLCWANSLPARNLLIICPASLRLNWLREASLLYDATPQAGFAVLSNKMVMQLSDKQFLKKNSPSPLICSYSMLVSNSHLFKYILHQPWDAIILDEGDCIRNTKSKQSKRVIELLTKQQTNTLFLTGTPLKNHATDLFAPLHLIIPTLPEPVGHTENNLVRSWYSFANTFCHVTRNRFGTQYTGVKNHELLRKLIRPDEAHDAPHVRFFYRKTKEQVLSDLPEKTYTKVDLSLSVSDVASLLSMSEQNEILRAFEEAVNSFSLRKDLKQKLMEARRLLGEAKANSPETLEYIKSIIEGSPNNCAVIFAHHRSVISTLKSKLLTEGYTVGVLDGQTNPTEKERVVRAFQSGEIEVFLGSLLAAGVGITLTRASDAIFIEYDWLPANNEQAADRLHRISAKYPVTIHYLLTQDSFEQKIVSRMIAKQKNIEKVI